MLSVCGSFRKSADRTVRFFSTFLHSSSSTLPSAWTTFIILRYYKLFLFVLCIFRCHRLLLTLANSPQRRPTRAVSRSTTRTCANALCSSTWAACDRTRTTTPSAANRPKPICSAGWTIIWWHVKSGPNWDLTKVHQRPEKRVQKAINKKSSF